MKPIVYFASWCPDTEPFFAELNRLGVEFEALDMISDLANFKAFLKLRDIPRLLMKRRKTATSAFRR